MSTKKSAVWPMRFAILGAVCLLFFIANLLLNQFEKQHTKPLSLTFKLPIPEETATRFGVPQRPDIEKVVVSGFFSDWDVTSPYELHQVAPDTWTIDLLLPPGSNQYKFVVSVRGKKDPVWVYDTTNPVRVKDTWGEYNSVLSVLDLPTYRLVMNAVFIGLLILLTISFFIEPIIHYILHLRLAFHIKLMIAMIFFVIISNSILILYHLHESRQLIKQGVIDNINMIHLVLSGRDIQFKTLSLEKEKIHVALSDFFWNSKTRVEKYHSSPYQITLSDLALLDENYKLIHLSHRNQNTLLQDKRAKNMGYATSEDLFMNGMFAPAIQESRAQHGFSEIVFNHPLPKIIAEEPKETQRAHRFLGYSTFVKPIFIQGKLVGFYAGAIQSKLYGGEISRIFYINLALITLISAISLFLLASVGKLITRYLSELTDWTQQIIKGNFNTFVSIKSGDEIEQLAENFNAMRLSLEEGFAQVAEKNALLQREAYYDSLTNLPNRKKMLLDLSARLSNALIIINIDSFRGLNDFFGTDIGDSLLIDVAHRLQKLTASAGLHTYKIGPDEFVVCIDDIDEHVDVLNNETIRSFTEQLCRQITEPSYIIGTNEINISVTAGISLSAINSSPKILFSQAANAMRIAKERLIGQLIYDASMEETQAFENNMTWAHKIKQAIDEDRIVPYFQPIVTNTTGHINKYECLVRLIEKDGTVVSPFAFLTIAKKARLYPFITQIMIAKSFALFSENTNEFSINISIDDILDQHTLAFIFSTIAQYPQAAERVVFEIIESSEIQNYEIVRHFISQVKVFGCRIAIDDFGSGYSNFAHIMSMNVDYLKIDGSLIRDLDTDNNAQITVRTIAEFAKKLGIETIAEFVHSNTVYEKTVEYGIDYSQGYHFGKPSVDLIQRNTA